RVVAQVDDCPPAIGVPDQRPVMVCTTRMADGGNADDARTMNGLYCRGRGLWGLGTQGDVRGRPSGFAPDAGEGSTGLWEVRSCVVHVGVDGGAPFSRRLAY